MLSVKVLLLKSTIIVSTRGMTIMAMMIITMTMTTILATITMIMTTTTMIMKSIMKDNGTVHDVVKDINRYWRAAASDRSDQELDLPKTIVQDIVKFNQR